MWPTEHLPAQLRVRLPLCLPRNPNFLAAGLPHHPAPALTLFCCTADSSRSQVEEGAPSPPPRGRRKSTTPSPTRPPPGRTRSQGPGSRPSPTVHTARRLARAAGHGTASQHTQRTVKPIMRLAKPASSLARRWSLLEHTHARTYGMCQLLCGRRSCSASNVRVTEVPPGLSNTSWPARTNTLRGSRRAAVMARAPAILPPPGHRASRCRRCRVLPSPQGRLSDACSEPRRWCRIASCRWLHCVHSCRCCSVCCRRAGELLHALAERALHLLRQCRTQCSMTCSHVKTKVEVQSRGCGYFAGKMRGQNGRVRGCLRGQIS